MKSSHIERRWGRVTSGTTEIRCLCSPKKDKKNRVTRGAQTDTGHRGPGPEGCSIACGGLLPSSPQPDRRGLPRSHHEEVGAAQQRAEQKEQRQPAHQALQVRVPIHAHFCELPGRDPVRIRAEERVDGSRVAAPCSIASSSNIVCAARKSAALLAISSA